MSPRSNILDERLTVRARVGTLAESAENTGGALTTIVWVAGIGFAVYATLNWILPALLGSATRTRSAYHGLKGVGPGASTRASSHAVTSSAPTYQYCSANPAAAECVGIL